MSTLDEERMHRLADVAPMGPARPLDQITSRGAQLRRYRRASVGSATTAGVAAVAAAALVLPGVWARGSSPPAADDDGAGSCDTGYAKLVDRASVPNLSYLFPSEAVGQRLDKVWARTEYFGENCPSSEPVATLMDYGRDGNTVDRAINVGIMEPLDDPSAKYDFGGEVPIDVRGVTGILGTDGEAHGILQLRWTEPDGTMWKVLTNGLSRVEMVLVANDLEFDADRVVPGSLPTGYDQVLYPDTPSAERRYWHVLYYSPTVSEDGDHDGVQLEVFTPAGPPVEAYAASGFAETARFGLVNGARAFYDKPGERTATLEWNTADGLSFRMSAELGFQEMIDLASQLERVSADDPRLDGVPQN